MEKPKESEERIKIVQYQADAFTSNLQNMTYISNALTELASSPSAIVFRNTLCCPIKWKYFCCGNFFPFTTLVNDGVTQKFLFKNLGLTQCSISPGDTLKKFASIKSFSLTSFDQYSSQDNGLEFSEVIKEPNCCDCQGCCSLYFDVNLKAENRLAGMIKYRGCCEDSCFNCCCGEKKEKGGEERKCCDCCKDCCHILIHYGDIIDGNKQFKYALYFRDCCCSYLPNFGTYLYVLRDANQNDVGRIEGRGRCIPLCGDTLTYTITFPLDATPELKLTIINAVMLMDMIYR